MTGKNPSDREDFILKSIAMVGVVVIWRKGWLPETGEFVIQVHRMGNEIDTGSDRGNENK